MSGAEFVGFYQICDTLAVQIVFFHISSPPYPKTGARISYFIHKAFTGVPLPQCPLYIIKVYPPVASPCPAAGCDAYAARRRPRY